LADVADEDVLHEYLDGLAVPDDAQPLFALDLRLETAELPLLAPVVERRHQHDDDDRRDDRRAFDVARVGLRRVAVSCNRTSSVYERKCTCALLHGPGCNLEEW